MRNILTVAFIARRIRDLDAIANAVPFDDGVLPSLGRGSRGAPAQQGSTRQVGRENGEVHRWFLSAHCRLPPGLEQTQKVQEKLPSIMRVATLQNSRGPGVLITRPGDSQQKRAILHGAHGVSAAGFQSNDHAFREISRSFPVKDERNAAPNRLHRDRPWGGYARAAQHPPAS